MGANQALGQKVNTEPRGRAGDCPEKSKYGEPLIFHGVIMARF
jgi:hypothetical protein